MSERKQATVQVASVTTKQVGAENKTMWTLKDGNGTEYTTFIPGRGNAAMGYEGGPAQIEWTEKQNGNWTNRYLEAIHPVAADTEASEPAANSNQPVDWDAKERRDFRSRAWAQALGATPRQDGETNKDYFTRVKPLAHAIFNDVCGDFAEPPPAGISGAELSSHDQEIPF